MMVAAMLLVYTIPFSNRYGNAMSALKYRFGCKNELKTEALLLEPCPELLTSVLVRERKIRDLASKKVA